MQHNFNQSSENLFDLSIALISPLLISVLIEKVLTKSLSAQMYGPGLKRTNKSSS